MREEYCLGFTRVDRLFYHCRTFYMHVVTINIHATATDCPANCSRIVTENRERVRPEHHRNYPRPGECLPTNTNSR